MSIKEQFDNLSFDTLKQKIVTLYISNFYYIKINKKNIIDKKVPTDFIFNDQYYINFINDIDNKKLDSNYIGIYFYNPGNFFNSSLTIKQVVNKTL